MEQTNSTDYLRFDEFKDVFVSIELLELVVEKLHTNPLLWKWAIIAAHDALQGAMVCALNDSAGIGALTKKSAGQRLQRMSNATRGPTPPKTILADFSELLRRIQDPACMGHLGGTAVTLDPKTKSDLDRLHTDLRNQFSHFAPTGWSIEIVGLPRIVDHALKLVDNLMLKQPSVRNRLKKSDATSLENRINYLSSKLSLATA